MAEMALDGIRVVEVSTWVAAPSTGIFLSDFGADVIRVEPLGGDPVRGLGRAEFNWMWEEWNRGKRGLAVDTRQEQGQHIMHQLVKDADVFLSNLRPGALKRAGLDYDTLSKLNPRLIYASQTGYGLRGAGTERPSFDEVGFWARGGLMSVLGEPDSPPPALRGAPGDHTTAMVTLAAICLALFVRERTGLGQQVETSLLATGVWVAGQSVQQYLTSGVEPARTSRRMARNPLSNTYKCKDGKWIVLAMFDPGRFWGDFLKAIGRKDLEDDARFDSPQKRVENCEELIRTLDDTLATKTRDEWAPLLDQGELIWGPMHTVREVAEDPYVLDNEYIVEYDHFSQGRIRGLACPLKLHRTPGRIKGGAPGLGQHTEEILLEMGHTHAEIEDLKQKKVVI